MLTSADVRHARILAVLLLLIGIPLLNLMQWHHRLRCQQVLLVHSVDIDAEMLAHEPNTERVSESADLERSARHRAVDGVSDVYKYQMRLQLLPVNHVRVSNHRCDLGVAVTTLRTLVDVRATDDGQAVVHNADLRVNVHLLGGEDIVAQLRPVPQGEEGDILVGL